jgi:hypothetical protein
MLHPALSVSLIGCHRVVLTEHVASPQEAWQGRYSTYQTGQLCCWVLHMFCVACLVVDVCAARLSTHSAKAAESPTQNQRILLLSKLSLPGSDCCCEPRTL